MAYTRDPVLLIVYVVDEHTDRTKRLRDWSMGLLCGSVPSFWPGGSVMINRHGGGL